MNKFNRLLSELDELKKIATHFNIGKTVGNRNIICFKIGNNLSRNKIFLCGGIHAREYITSFLLIKMIKFLQKFNIDSQIYIVPVVNFDGIDICINGTKNIKNQYKKLFIKNLCKGKDYKYYKANFNGVDINTNFDALWGKGKYNNLNRPNYQNFVGFYKNSEPETKALINFVQLIKPNITLCYHSKGEVVYWGFKSDKKFDKVFKKNQKNYLKSIIKSTKYKAVFTKNSCGGLKDFCLYKLNLHSFTIEVGNDKLLHPISLDNLQSIFDKNKLLVLNLIKKI